MGRVRDTNRSRIEQVEADMMAHCSSVINITPAGANKFAQHTIKRSWIQKQLKTKVDVEVVVDFARTSYTNGCEPKTHDGTTYTINVAPNMITKLHILHSIAHLLNPRSYGEVSHDTQFVKTYLELVRRFFNGQIDEDIKRRFKRSLMEHGVKTKEVSEATREKQRAAWIRRMTPTEDQLLETLRALEDM